MRTKRVLQWTALTALAAAAWMGAGTVDASAAEAPVFSIDNVGSISTGGALTIKTKDTGYKEIMFGVASYNKNKNTVKIADTAWDVYETGNSESISIDLSKLSLTKDNYIAIKSESTKPIYLKVEASVKSQKVKYDATSHKLGIENIKKVGTDVNESSIKWEYRTTYSSWCDFDEKNDVFTEYEPQGATLYVRAKAGTLDQSEESGVKDATNNPVKVYKFALMPGKESKVNIKKMANGPSVSVNYTAGSLKLPNNTEYRVIASGGAIPDKTQAGGGTKTVAELLEASDVKTATSGTIEVRKTASGSKTASKWTRIDMEIAGKIDITNAKQGGTVLPLGDTASIEATGGAITLANGITIEVTTATSGSNKGKVNGIKVTVPTDAKYDFNFDVGGTKPTTVKNGASGKTIKITEGKEIKIGIAGNKKSKQWVGEYISIGKVK